MVEPRTALALAIVSAAGGRAGGRLRFQSLGDAGASGAAGFDEARGRQARVLVRLRRGQRGKMRVAAKGHRWT